MKIVASSNTFPNVFKFKKDEKEKRFDQVKFDLTQKILTVAFEQYARQQRKFRDEMYHTLDVDFWGSI